MSGLAHIRKISVPVKVTTETQKFLRTVGQRGNEGLALWCGRPDGEHFEVTQLLIPQQRGVRTADGVCAIVDSDELHRINTELYKSGLRMIAQIHSHPTDAYHSDTDDENAIANTIGCFSLVVPDFGAGNFNLASTAVYRLAQDGEWQELDQRSVAAMIQLG